MRKLLAAVVVIAALFAVVVAGALAGNPSPTGTGQPDQSCGSTGPPGIISTTNGFATTAVNVYANPKALPNGNEINSHAVSQYDVACTQVSTH